MAMALYTGTAEHRLNDGRVMVWKPTSDTLHVFGNGRRAEMKGGAAEHTGVRGAGHFKPTGPARVFDGRAKEQQNTKFEEFEPGLAARLFIGLNVKNETVWDEHDIEDAVLEVRGDQGADPGASYMMQRGTYLQKGVLIEEPSVAVYIVDTARTNPDRWEKDMRQLAAKLRERFNQESVLLELQHRGIITKVISAYGPVT